MDELFKGKSPDEKKLLGFGFRKEGGVYRYSETAGEFRTDLSIENGVLSARTFDLSTGEQYTLHLVPEAQGEFVGGVRAAYRDLLERVAACFSPDAFRSDAARALLEYANKTYGGAPEYLWEKFPEDAVLRRGDNAKWYAAFMAIPAEKIGLTGGRLEIVDVRADPAEIARLLDGTRYFAGYHMNKTHWLTMPLDGRVSSEELASRLDASYLLAK